MRRVKHVKVIGDLSDLKLWICFDNEIIVVRSFKQLVKKGGVFAKLSDPSFFAKVRVSKSKGTIQWPGELDLCPDALYDGGKEIRTKRTLVLPRPPNQDPNPNPKRDPKPRM